MHRRHGFSAVVCNWISYAHCQNRISCTYLCFVFIISLVCYRYDHPHILAGQGTMGLEIIEQVPDLDACIIPVGGAGLIAGTALAIKSLRPHVKIIVCIH